MLWEEDALEDFDGDLQGGGVLEGDAFVMPSAGNLKNDGVLDDEEEDEAAASLLTSGGSASS